MQTLPVGDRRLGAAAVLSVFLHFSAACLAHAASAPDVAAGQGAPSNFFPRGCSGLRLEGPLGVCSSFSDAGGKSSSSWLAFSPPLLDGCSAFVLLVMLLLLMDSAGLLLPTFWSRVFSLLASIRASSSNDGTAGLSAARTPELHALEQQEQQLQRELRQYTPSSDFVAYSRLRRQLAKVTAAKESCMRRQQQQNNSSSDNGEGGLWASLLWPIMKPVLLANSWMLMKRASAWTQCTDTLIAGYPPGFRGAKTANRKPLERRSGAARPAAPVVALAGPGPAAPCSLPLVLQLHQLPHMHAVQEVECGASLLKTRLSSTLPRSAVVERPPQLSSAVWPG